MKLETKEKIKRWPANQTHSAPFQPIDYAEPVMLMNFFLQVKNINSPHQKIMVAWVRLHGFNAFYHLYNGVCNGAGQFLVHWCTKRSLQWCRPTLGTQIYLDFSGASPVFYFFILYKDNLTHIISTILQIWRVLVYSWYDCILAK